MAESFVKVFKNLLSSTGGRSGKLREGILVKHCNYFTSKHQRRFTFTRSITIISHQTFNCFHALFQSPVGISLSEEMCRRAIIWPSAPFGHLYLLYLRHPSRHSLHCTFSDSPLNCLFRAFYFAFSRHTHFSMDSEKFVRNLYVSCITIAYFDQNTFPPPKHI